MPVLADETAARVISLPTLEDIAIYIMALRHCNVKGKGKKESGAEKIQLSKESCFKSNLQPGIIVYVIYLWHCGLL